MPKSATALTLDGVQAGLTRFLQPLGFRSRQRTFNRTTADGLTQVINLQMGRFDPPGTYEIAELRENLYGRFTVNLGLYVPEVCRGKGFGPTGPFIPEGHNTISGRLGYLGPERCDLWWLITSEASVVIELVQRVDRDALPFFARLENREAVLEFLDAPPREGFMVVAPRIKRAAILAELGRTGEAVAEIHAAIAQQPGSEPYLRKFAQRLGLTLDP